MEHHDQWLFWFVLSKEYWGRPGNRKLADHFSPVHRKQRNWQNPQGCGPQSYSSSKPWSFPNSTTTKGQVFKYINPWRHFSFESKHSLRKQQEKPLAHFCHALWCTQPLYAQPLGNTWQEWQNLRVIEVHDKALCRAKKPNFVISTKSFLHSGCGHILKSNQILF